MNIYRETNYHVTKYDVDYRFEYFSRTQIYETIMEKLKELFIENINDFYYNGVLICPDNIEDKFIELLKIEDLEYEESDVIELFKYTNMCLMYSNTPYSQLYSSLNNNLILNQEVIGTTLIPLLIHSRMYEYCENYQTS